MCCYPALHVCRQGSEGLLSHQELLRQLMVRATGISPHIPAKFRSSVHLLTRQLRPPSQLVLRTPSPWSALPHPLWHVGGAYKGQIGDSALRGTTHLLCLRISRQYARTGDPERTHTPAGNWVCGLKKNVIYLAVKYPVIDFV